ncbi:hypothetical protein Pcinc_018920 [Petrolisthes cinctipes]|uniref:Uncharacterized protein n=1 Tax=Petrolisthes cinctipes TaxID=88211 RepID=A0AAE1KM73_PETCI|nr:hypothetical protein Pcinc_018920 [Petrolisthes cinctipes]
MACIEHLVPTTTQQVQLLHCMMSKSYPAYTLEPCGKELGLDWTPIAQCSGSTHGSGLLYKNGVRTAALQPRITFIPTITLDGRYDQFQLRSSLTNLQQQVCEAYQGPRHQACI